MVTNVARSGSRPWFDEAGTLRVPVMGSLPRLEEPFELELAVADASVEEPGTLEELVVIGAACDVGSWPAGGAGHEADLLEALLHPPPGEHWRSECGFDKDPRRVEREHRDRVRPHRWVIAVALDVALVEAAGEAIVGTELVDPDPAFEL